MKRYVMCMGAILLGAILAGAASAYKSFSTPMTGTNTVIVVDGRFKTPMLITSAYVLLPSGNTSTNTLVMRFARGSFTNTVWTSSFTNSMFFLPNPGLTADTGDIVIFDNNVTNGTIILNYQN